MTSEHWSAIGATLVVSYFIIGACALVKWILPKQPPETVQGLSDGEFLTVMMIWPIFVIGWCMTWLWSQVDLEPLVPGPTYGDYRDLPKYRDWG